MKVGDRIWFPFVASDTLPQLLLLMGHELAGLGEGANWEDDTGVDALYIGTPTIVDGGILFPETVPALPKGAMWTKRLERRLVQSFVEKAIERGAKRIVTGLGEGDISAEERIEDMGGGGVVCMKRFRGFTDWVLLREDLT